MSVTPKAYLVSGGIGSLAAAAFLIRDGGLRDSDISIFEAGRLPGGSLDRMPCITNLFMPRMPGDPPSPVPAGSRNLAIVSQFVEIPDDVVFTVEYSVRAAQMAVYQLLGIRWAIPPVTPHDKSLGTRLEALLKAFAWLRGKLRRKPTALHILTTPSFMKHPPVFVLLALAALAGLSLNAPAATSNSITKGQPVAPFTPQFKPGEYVWRPEVSPAGPVVIIISLPEQILYVYRNGVRIGRTSVSSGKAGHRTPTGVFTILEKNREHVSSIYRGASMPFMERLTWGGVAMHAGNLPGYPAAHGCVRMPLDFAQGTLHRHGPGDDGHHHRRQGRARTERRARPALRRGNRRRGPGGRRLPETGQGPGGSALDHRERRGRRGLCLPRGR